MLASSYNNKGLKDVLAVMTKESQAADQKEERKGNTARIFNKDTGETVGYNFFEASSLLSFNNNGPVNLSKEDIVVLNKEITENGFEDELTADPSPKFVVGYVKECKPHEDSDHLNVTQTEVDGGEVLQIVCGAANIDQGQKVVVAKPGAIMPNGLVIWPGSLRGVESSGMICSGKELGLKGDFEKGILVLEESAEVGSEFQLVN